MYKNVQKMRKKSQISPSSDYGINMTPDDSENKERKKKPTNSMTLSSLNDMARTTTKALMDMSSRQQKRASKEDGDEKFDDSDYVFSMLVYQKMKEVPNGCDKDDLQLEIQRLINQTKRNTSSRPTYPQGQSMPLLNSVKRNGYPSTSQIAYQVDSHNSFQSTLLDDTLPYPRQNSWPAPMLGSAPFHSQQANITYPYMGYPTSDNAPASNSATQVFNSASPDSDVASV